MACEVIKFPGGGGAVICGGRTDADRDHWARTIRAVTPLARLSFSGGRDQQIPVDFALSCGHTMRRSVQANTRSFRVGMTMFCGECHAEGSKAVSATIHFRARWNGKDFECKRDGKDIDFRPLDKPDDWWRTLPSEDFYRLFERIEDEPEPGTDLPLGTMILQRGNQRGKPISKDDKREIRKFARDIQEGLFG